jgi:hypothetical protein
MLALQAAAGQHSPALRSWPLFPVVSKLPWEFRPE